MKVFKFGGASVKDAESVKNVSVVLGTQGFNSCLVVVSAMGKTTNALEKVVETYFVKGDFAAELEDLQQKHLAVAQDLFPSEHAVFSKIKLIFQETEAFLRRNKSPNYNFVYDQVVSCGELVSSVILSQYLNYIKFSNSWIDAREYIKTDHNYREANLDWERTKEHMSSLDRAQCYVTQGFIGADENNFTVTLGREGSDYSAAIFAFCLKTDSLTIWKDVPGVMTGDPRKFQNVELLDHISYEEAIEMAYYGASVIHPKTLQPLMQQQIPFYVKSFLEPTKAGTRVGSGVAPAVAQSFILKENQHLLRIATRDFSFIAEEHLSQIFSLLAKYKVKISLMQNSAISLDLCVDDLYNGIESLLSDLAKDFQTELTREVSLFTIRNANLDELNNLYNGREILLEQVAKRTVQAVLK